MQARRFQELKPSHQRGERIAQLVPERCQEFVLALVGDTKRFLMAGALFEMPADLVLALACANRGPDGAEKRRDTKRPLQKRDVAERPHRFAQFGRVGTGTGEDEDWKIGPGGLVGEHLVQRRGVGERDRFFGHDHRGRTPPSAR